jgi:hydroxyethylthiazole kinase
MIKPGDVAETLALVRARAPVVQNITNLVVTNSTANALLAIGASPAMIEGADEVEEFLRVADSLVVNLGTMSADRAAAMRLATAAAQQLGRPWVLDPVAVGVVGYRSRLAEELIWRGPAAIRGNASEIISLAGGAGAGRGVDAGPEARMAAAQDAARDLARRTGAVVAVTGAVDHATDGERCIACHNGDPLMTRVTGMGCTATAIIGACLAVQPDRLAAVAHGLALTGLAGELAAARSRGPGSLQVAFLDALHAMDAAALEGVRLA